MSEQNIAFEKYIEAFKQLQTNDKRDEVVSSIKELVILFDDLCQNKNIEPEYLNSDDIPDLMGNNVSEDSYLEGILIYMEIAKNLIGQYFENTTN